MRIENFEIILDTFGYVQIRLDALQHIRKILENIGWDGLRGRYWPVPRCAMAFMWVGALTDTHLQNDTKR